MKRYIETPYGEIYRDEEGNLTLEYETLDFVEFSPEDPIDSEIDLWLIDNGYRILDRSIYFNDPIVKTLNYIYFNQETQDYEEVDVPVSHYDDIDVGSFMLKYKLERS